MVEDKELRKYITKSKKYCEQMGLDPELVPNFKNCLSPLELKEKRKTFSIALEAADKVAEIIMEYSTNMPLIFLVNDKDGYLLDIKGDKLVLQQLNLAAGVKVSEEESGTSSGTLALMYNRPVQLVGKDHYHIYLHAGACYTAPFADKNTGEVMGTISLMTDKKNHNPLFLGLMNALAKSMEKEIAMKKAALTNKTRTINGLRL